MADGTDSGDVTQDNDTNLLDDGDLSKVPSCAALNQGNIRCQAHAVHVIPGNCEWEGQTDPVTGLFFINKSHLHFFLHLLML